jgi:hypothetical protein
MSNWPAAIETNRAALLRIVAVLFFYAGLDEGGADVVPRRVWRRIVRLLRPAESAVRRLIVIAARNIEIEPPKPRAEKPPTGIERLVAAGVLTFHDVNLGLARAWQPQAEEPQPPEPRIRAFPLTDPLRRFDTRSRDGKRPFPQGGFDLADADEEVDARHLCRRIAALKAALDDLPGQARRLARWRARRDFLASRSLQGGSAPASAGQRLAAYDKEGAKLKGANNRYKRLSVMRPGWPPGYRRRPVHAVDDILRDLHSLAIHAGKLDSS